MNGRFKPKNPSKYIGDSSNIIYRSSWENKFMGYLDRHDEIKNWSSEELRIPYRSPLDGRWHVYYPDFLVTKINSEGRRETLVVEIKPAKQTKAPVQQGKKPSRKYLAEVREWGRNSAKWEAAKRYCEERDWKFIILTERELNIPSRKDGNRK